MLKRLFVGTVEGGSLGAAVALAVFAIHSGWNAPVAYAAVSVVGAATGLVAGKPIWATGAKVEAGLKAAAGVFLAAMTMFGIRKWLAGFVIDLSPLGMGRGALGELPRLGLPLIGIAIAWVFEIDDAVGVEAGAARLPPSGNDSRES